MNRKRAKVKIATAWMPIDGYGHIWITRMMSTREGCRRECMCLKHSHANGKRGWFRPVLCTITPSRKAKRCRK